MYPRYLFWDTAYTFSQPLGWEDPGINVKKVTGSGSECTPGNSWELDQPEKGSLPLGALYAEFSRPDIDDGANEERERDGTGWRMESADLQSGRYLQVKSSHCRERLRTPHRLDNPADRRDSFHSAIAPWHGCHSRSNFASIDKNADRAFRDAPGPRLRDYALFSPGDYYLMTFFWCPHNHKAIDTLLSKTEALIFYSLKDDHIWCKWFRIVKSNLVLRFKIRLRQDF